VNITSGLLAGLGLFATPVCSAVEWKDLFDGKTLDGWESQTTANWHVEGGAITADHGREGLLTSTESYTDYEVEITFRAKEDTRSGIYLSTPKTVTDPSSECYALAIAPDSSSFPTGSLTGRSRVPGEKYEGWRTYHAKIQGATVTVWLDGKQVLEYKDRKPIHSGRIGLEFNQGRVEFSKIRVKNLGMP
jgi:hypothetical protein